MPPALSVTHAELYQTLNHQQANVYGVLGPGAREVALGRRACSLDVNEEILRIYFVLAFGYRVLA